MADDTIAQAATATQQQQQNKPAPDLGTILGAILGQASGQQPTVPLTTNGPSGGTFIPPVRKEVAPVNIGGGREYGSKGAAKNDAIHNLFGNIASQINTAKQNNDAQKARKLAIDVEKIYTAQAGVTQAEQQLKQNPNDPNAKQMLEHNKQLINDLLSDPKKRKELEEAFNYSFIGDDKKAGSWQRKAGQMGAKSYQEQLAQQMPQTEQINQTAVAQQKAQMEQIKAMAPIITSIIRGQGEQQRTDVIRQNKQDELAEKNIEAQLKHMDSEDLHKLYGARTEVENRRVNAAFQANQIKFEGLKAKIGQEGLSNVLRANKQAGDNINDQIKSLTTRLNSLSNIGSPSDQQKAEMQMLQTQLGTLRQRALDNFAKQAALSYSLSGQDPTKQTVNTTGGASVVKSAIGSSNSNSSSNTGGAATTTNDPNEEYTDDDFD